MKYDTIVMLISILVTLTLLGIGLYHYYYIYYNGYTSLEQHNIIAQVATMYGLAAFIIFSLSK